MFRIVSFAAIVLVASGSAFANPVVDEDTVRAISAEMVEAAEKGDASIIEKYYYPGSKIVVDMDPADNVGETEVDYADFLMLAEMGMASMAGADIDVKITDVQVDKSRNEATIEEHATIVAEMMGVKVAEVSVTETRFGVVNGEIKVLASDNRLISIDAVQ